MILCENSERHGHKIISPQCASNPAEFDVLLTYPTGETERLQLCFICASVIRTHSQAHNIWSSEEKLRVFGKGGTPK